MKLQKQKTIVYDDTSGARVFAEDNCVSISSFYCLHWIFIITLPLIGGIWSSCEDGYPWACHGIFLAYLLFAISMEFAIVWKNEEFWRWMKSKSKVCAKNDNCRLPWKVLAFVYAAIGACSRADLYTDLTFLWTAYHCDLYFAEAVVVMSIGVGCCQCCIPSVWSGYFLLDFTQVSVVSMLRVSDAMVLANWNAAMTAQKSDAHDGPAAVVESSKNFDGMMAIIRFIFEDLSQTILQLLFLFHESRPSITDRSNLLVLISVILAFCLSFMRVVLFIIDPVLRKALVEFINWTLSLCGDCLRDEHLVSDSDSTGI